MQKEIFHLFRGEIASAFRRPSGIGSRCGFSKPFRPRARFPSSARQGRESRRACPSGSRRCTRKKGTGSRRREDACREKAACAALRRGRNIFPGRRGRNRPSTPARWDSSYSAGRADCTSPESRRRSARFRAFAAAFLLCQAFLIRFAEFGLLCDGSAVPGLHESPGVRDGSSWQDTMSEVQDVAQAAGLAHRLAQRRAERPLPSPAGSLGPRSPEAPPGDRVSAERPPDRSSSPR